MIRKKMPVPSQYPAGSSASAPAQRGDDEIARRTRQLRAIAELGQAALTGVDIEMLLGQTCGLVESVLNTRRCSIVQVADQAIQVLCAIGGPATHDLTAAVLAAVHGEPLLHAVETAETCPSIATRIGGHNRAFGVLCVERLAGESFADDELEFLRAVADLTGAIIEQARTRDALAVTERRFQALVENSSDGILLIGANGCIRYAAPSTARILQYNAGQLEGTPFGVILDRSEAPAWDAVEQALQQSPERPVTLELQLRTRSGAPVWVEASAANLLDNDAVAAIVVNYRDITERKEAEKQLEHLAYRDGLTGLPNRFLFNDRVHHAIDQSRRRGRGLALLYLDLDRFKLVNDTLGHAVGDQLLNAVANRLRSIVRLDDTIARLGGDEFAILLPDIDRAEDAGRIANKLLHSLREPFVVGEHQLYSAASIGVSIFPADGDNVEALLKNADSALYRAKELGRNNVQLFTAAMNERYRRRLGIELALRRAIDGDLLQLHYQPIIDNRTGKVRAFEALMRWDNDGESISPSSFIPVAEETGLISRLCDFAIHRACRDLRNWRDAGLPPFAVSVNLSAHDLARHDLVATIESAIKQQSIRPGELQVEVTESAALDNVEVAMSTLAELRRLGVGVAVDDFGTGQSSLVYLKRLPLDVVKLDREFLRDTTNACDMALLGSIIDLVHSLDLYVVAEGIETDSELTLIRTLGCDGSQGYVFSRAVPASAVWELLQRFR